MAGCHGDFYRWPDSEETEAQLRAIIARTGLGLAVQANFPTFRPLWRALWTTSPLRPSSLPVLRTLIGEMLAEDRLQCPGSGHLEELEQFVAALDLAECQGLRLHVELLPLGHTEGEYTIFPHCPYCKSEARGLGRFRRRYHDVLQTCLTCGTEFSPARTASTKRMPHEHDRLRRDLGDERFRQLAQDFLIQSGEKPRPPALSSKPRNADIANERRASRRSAPNVSRKSNFWPNRSTPDSLPSGRRLTTVKAAGTKALERNLA